MPQQDTIALIKAYIKEHFPAARKRGLDNSNTLLQSGVIDSMGILDVVSYVEAEFGISVSDDDLLPENFNSIAAIAKFVEKKLILQ